MVASGEVAAPPMGVANLAAFVAVTVGRPGRVEQVPGGTVVASAVPVANGYLNAAFRTDGTVPAVDFLDAARNVFADAGMPYVVWAESTDDELRSAAGAAGGVADATDTPAMVVTEHVSRPHQLDVRAVDGAADRATFVRLCEDGYGMAGLAWMLESQGCLDAPGTTWAIASAGGVDLSVACGFDDGATGGIYYVATPPAHRGQGAASAVTAWLTDRLLDGGASQVTLQASEAGYPVYQRLGFTTPGGFRRHTFDRPS
jgi:GNAT superfamily N-acetyltransferase